MEKQIKALFNQTILEQAGRLFGVTLEEINIVGGFENFIYTYSQMGQDYILRISHHDHRTLNMVQAELEWVNFLAENGANVSKPIRSIHNHLVEQVADEEGTYFTVTAYEKAKGRHTKREDYTTAFYEVYGQIVGRLHRLTKEYEASSTHKRIEWDEEAFIKHAASYLPDQEQQVARKLTELVDYLRTLPKDIESYGLIHTDLHGGNFFIHEGQMTVFDFDDSAYMWFISDIAVVLFYLLERIEENEQEAFTNAFMTHFMRGYRKENRIDSFWLSQIPYFLKLREIIVYIVIHRSFDTNNLGDWAKNYINVHKSRIEADVPLVNTDFSLF